MPITRVSTYALHRDTLSDVTRTQSDLAKLQNQVSSGLKSQDFQGLHGQVESFVQLEAKMNKTGVFINTATIVKSRLQTTDVALDQIIAIAEDFRNLLVQRQNPVSGDDLQFAIQTDAFMKATAAQLNTSQEGRYLFGGSRTDIPPVPTPIQGNATPGVPDANYYQGNSENLVARISENYEITYNVRGDDIAFQQLFAAFSLGLQGDSSGNGSGVLADAQQLASDALDSLIAVRARVQQNMVNVEETSERHVQLNLYWKGITEEISKTDILSASTEIALNEAILQASFSSFARLNELRLTDFLR